MDIFKEFSTDDAKENSGVWKSIGGNTSLLVARAGNRAYSKLLTSLVEENQRILDSKTEAATKLSDDIIIEVLAKTVLLGWKGVEHEGVDLSYSVDSAKWLLSVKDFRALVGKISADVDLYRTAQEVEDVKN